MQILDSDDKFRYEVSDWTRACLYDDRCEDMHFWLHSPKPFYRANTIEVGNIIGSIDKVDQ